jgi:hypothetical protein
MSAAASATRETSLGGRSSWKNAEDKTLAEVEAAATPPTRSERVAT